MAWVVVSDPREASTNGFLIRFSTLHFGVRCDKGTAAISYSEVIFFFFSVYDFLMLSPSEKASLPGYDFTAAHESCPKNESVLQFYSTRAIAGRGVWTTFPRSAPETKEFRDLQSKLFSSFVYHRHLDV